MTLSNGSIQTGLVVPKGGYTPAQAIGFGTGAYMKKVAARYKLEPAKLHELNAIVALENKAWPPPKNAEGNIQADAEKFESRIQKGCLFLLKEWVGDMEVLVGMITAQKVDLISEGEVKHALALHKEKGILPWEELTAIGFPLDWYQATAHGTLESHKPEGKIGWLVGVSVDPNKRGQHLVDMIISAALRIMHSQGMNYAVGYGRLPQLHEFYKDPEGAIPHLKEYLEKSRDEDWLNPDYGVRFHQRNGAKVISAIPYSMAPEDDWESLGHGFLALYNLKELISNQ